MRGSNPLVFVIPEDLNSIFYRKEGKYGERKRIKHGEGKRI